MAGSWQLNLIPQFVQQLVDWGFRCVGYYEILEGNICKICVDDETGR